jgi:hypothetical protein
MRTFAAAGVDVKVPLHGHFAPAAAAAASSSLPLSKCQRANCPFAAHSQAPPQMRGNLKFTRHTSHVTRHTSHVTHHTSHDSGHCCVACLQNAGSHGPACQQAMWRSSLTSPAAAAAAAPARAAAAPVSSSQAPSAAAGGEVELVLECAAAMRSGAVGDVNPLQVCLMMVMMML